MSHFKLSETPAVIGTDLFIFNIQQFKLDYVLHMLMIIEINVIRNHYQTLCVKKYGRQLNGSSYRFNGVIILTHINPIF